jgi:DNA repair exonuclease SbcCD ATPase subunit
MSERPKRLYPSFREFIEDISEEFDGTSFQITCPDGKVRRFNVSQCANGLYWDDVTKKFEEAKKYDSSIKLDIPFCIAYHVEIQPNHVKEVFGWKIQIYFPVPQNVQKFFKYRTVLQLDKKAKSLTLELQSENSAISELNNRLGSSKSYLLELIAEVEQFRRDLAEIQSNFHKADEQLTALTNLEEASRKVSSLFRTELSVLRPEFFTVMQDCKKRLEIYSDQMCALKNHISGKDKMVSDQRDGVALIEANLRTQAQKQNETKSALLTTRQKIYQELSSFEGDDLPHQLRKYVEELRLHTNMQQAALVLAKHLKKLSDRSFVASRIESAPKECSICFDSNLNYFMLDCGHAPFCDICVSKLESGSYTCPFCRTKCASHKSLGLFDSQLFLMKR